MRLLIMRLIAYALAGAALLWTPGTPDSTTLLIAARARAYDATARNDAAGLQRALAAFETLAAQDNPGPWPSYYASWSAWNLAASYLQANDPPAAKAALETAVRHARRAVALDAGSAECQNMLANAMIGLAVTDRTQFQTLAAELTGVRAKALELGPRNPRVVMMHAGMIFNIPPENGGDQRKGIARWLEAIALFDEEAATPPGDEREPRWGRDLASGWLSGLYLRLTPPDLAKAREAADRGLLLRPDFWWLRHVVLPKLKDAR